ncbi:phosphatidylinositol-4-phosphate 5-kinase its3 [Sugiyamaella lignohabitans]|uniref:Phosphatidylinositol-4-phosphate 5-kinase its3 n=1 Tax=Sugiyamaella lignohabitans TaxID=796027 RepID=A0A167D568_9ASCO|nr:phosphatidylinositol-4-phosphate 5-kinase its3 [Sugiyamaella lignohabitans]ANB12496.1 phosphatidylinositol-4-phosphate 5-kinase its3 [Sugiyamaella lignohabitans]
MGSLGQLDSDFCFPPEQGELDRYESSLSSSESGDSDEEELDLNLYFERSPAVIRALEKFDQFMAENPNHKFSHRPARLSAFDYHQDFIPSHCPVDSDVTVESIETLDISEDCDDFNLENKPIDIEEDGDDTASIYSDDFESDEDECPHWPVYSVSDYIDLINPDGGNPYEISTELLDTSEAVIESSDVEPTTSGDDTLVDSTDDELPAPSFETTSSGISVLEKLAKFERSYRDIVARIPYPANQAFARTDSAVDNLVSKVTSIEKTCQALDAEEPHAESLVEAGKPLSWPEDDTSYFVPDIIENLDIPIIDVTDDKGSFLKQKLKSKVSSLKRKFAIHKRAPISKSALMFKGIQTAIYANPRLIDPEVTLPYVMMGLKKYRLGDGSIIDVHSPLVYDNIRTLCGISHRELLNSFMDSDLVNSHSYGGRLVTPDAKYIIKTIQCKEHKLMGSYEFLDEYYYRVKENPTTQLPFYLGHYTIHIDGKETHFVIMKNMDHLNPNGSISVERDERDKFMTQLRKDVDLLKKHGITNYSLMVGLECDPHTGEQRPVTEELVEGEPVVAVESRQIQSCNNQHRSRSQCGSG